MARHAASTATLDGLVPVFGGFPHHAFHRRDGPPADLVGQAARGKVSTKAARSRLLAQVRDGASGQDPQALVGQVWEFAGEFPRKGLGIVAADGGGELAKRRLDQMGQGRLLFITSR